MKVSRLLADWKRGNVSVLTFDTPVYSSLLVRWAAEFLQSVKELLEEPGLML